MKLSIVSTLYYSAPYLKEFYERITRSANKITNDYEIILVNDGSPDDSLAIVVSIYEKDNKVKIIDLSRNFGHHRAIMTGLSYAKGDYIFLIDCDLEEEPELLEKFYQEMATVKDIDVIYGKQKKRKGGFVERVGGAVFYFLFNILSDIKITKDLIIARLMTRRYVDNLLKYKDKEPFISGICSLVGFKQRAIEVEKHNKGTTTYTILKRFNALINAIISFSSRPLIYIFYLGLGISVLSLFFIIYLIIMKLLLNTTVEGWISIMVSVWFLGGLIMCAIGIVGLYLSKIFNEVKDRPSTVIRQVYQK